MKIHYAYESGGELISHCGRGNAKTTDQAEVTCNNCQKSVLGLARVTPSMWAAHLADLAANPSEPDQSPS